MKVKTCTACDRVSLLESEECVGCGGVDFITMELSPSYLDELDDKSAPYNSLTPYLSGEVDK